MYLPLPPPPEIGTATVLTGELPASADPRYGEYVFGSVDYLLFWIRRGPTPTPISTVPTAVAVADLAGTDLPPGAVANIFPGELDYDSFNGARGWLGRGLTADRVWSVDGSDLQRFEETVGGAVASTGVPVIGRSFVDVGAGRETFLYDLTPDGLTRGRSPWTPRASSTPPTPTSGRRGRPCSPTWVPPPSPASGSPVAGGAGDRQRGDAPGRGRRAGHGLHVERVVPGVRNEFYGPQVGFASQYRYGCVTLDVTGKLAMGVVNQQVQIDGFATSQVQGQAAQTFPNQSILFVQTTNAGTYTRTCSPWCRKCC